MLSHLYFLDNFDFEIKQEEEEDDNIDPKDSMLEITEQCLNVNVW